MVEDGQTFCLSTAISNSRKVESQGVRVHLCLGHKPDELLSDIIEGVSDITQYSIKRLTLLDYTKPDKGRVQPFT